MPPIAQHFSISIFLILCRTLCALKFLSHRFYVPRESMLGRHIDKSTKKFARCGPLQVNEKIEILLFISNESNFPHTLINNKHATFKIHCQQLDYQRI